VQNAEFRGDYIMDYAEFRKQYQERYPASVPVLEPAMREYPRWLSWIVLVMFISAALLSGVHTVPTVRRGIETDDLISAPVRDAVSLSAFVAIELGIFVSAYLMVAGGGRDKWLAWLMLALAATVAIVANLYSVSRALMSGGEAGVTLVGVIIGICLPTIALASGKMYVSMHRADTSAEQRVRRAYREACQQFDVQVSEAYEAYERRMDAREQRRLSTVHSVNGVNEPSNSVHSTNGVNGHGAGYSKNMNARELAQQWLNANRERMNDPLDALVEAIQAETGQLVGRGSVHNARTEIRNRERGN